MKRTGIGGRRPGAGRPRKPRAEKQGRSVTLALTEAEHAALRRAAGREPHGTYVRTVLLRHLARRKKGGST